MRDWTHPDGTSLAYHGDGTQAHRHARETADTTRRALTRAQQATRTPTHRRLDRARRP